MPVIKKHKQIWVNHQDNEEEKQKIKNTLITFKKNYVEPGNRFVRNRYRALARDRKLNQFNVVPPSSAEEIKNAPGTTKEEKLKALKTYFPEMFQ